MSKSPTKCLTCGSKVYPKKGFYECCGIKESVKYVEQANEDCARPRRSIKDILFRMNHGVYPEQITDSYYDEFEAQDDH